MSMKGQSADQLLEEAALDSGSDIPEEVAADAMRAIADAIGRRAMANVEPKPKFAPYPSTAVGTLVVEFDPEADWDESIRFMEKAMQVVTEISPAIVTRIGGGDVQGLCTINRSEKE